MSELGQQRPIDDMPDFSPMDDGSEYQPSSSGEEESDYEAHQPRQGKENIQMCEAHVTMNHHHLRADASIQVGTVISIGETLELHDKSFLTVTALGTSKDRRSDKFVGHLFRRIDEFQEYLPATSGGSELVWLCEAKKKVPKPEGYLRSACGKDVLRIRKLVLTDSDCAPETVAQCQATGMGMVTEPLFCRWRLVAELSDSHVKGGARKLRSILGGSKEKPKAFMLLSHQELYNGENLATECSNSQQDLETDAPTAGLDGRRPESTKHGRSAGREFQTSKHQGREVGKASTLGPNTAGNRISKSRSQSSAPVKNRHSSAIRGKSSYREGNVTRTVRSPSLTGLLAPEQISKEDFYTFADAFCGAGGMSSGARAAGLRIRWAFDHNGCAMETYSVNHGRDVGVQMSAVNFELEASGSTEGYFKVDILHLSPPCNGFSRAYRGPPRVAVKANECMTYVGAIVEKVKPRIVTLKEVREVLFRYREYFTTMIHNLTSMGYSVKWRLIECADFGLPQKRRRLFMIASW